jgi:ribose transport system permease protein
MPTATEARRSITARRGPIDAFPQTGQNWAARLTPLRTTSDLVKKSWMEGAVPLALAALLTVVVLLTTPLSGSDTKSIFDEVSEKGLLAVGLTIVMLAGGIDLSIGSMVGVAAIGSLVAQRAWGLPFLVILIGTPLVGALLGSVNGFLIAKVKTRPFITTLVTLLFFRGIVDLLQSTYTIELASPSTGIGWLFLGEGKIAGLPVAWVIFAVVVLIAQLGLTRSRWGWWVTSVGSDRRSARRNGIPVTGVLFGTYALSGLLAGLAGLLTAARLGRSDSGVGEGWELIVLTAVVLGGVSLKGGRGSVVRATIGVIVVAIIQQASIALRMEAGGLPAILAMVLLFFAILDLKWGKYRGRIAEKLALDPGKVSFGPLLDVTAPGTNWTVNYALTDAPPIGLGRVEGPEDCQIDDAGNVYCGDRRGWIWKFAGIEDKNGSVFARTGGMPLGHVWDRDGSLLVAVGGLGVQRILADGSNHTVVNRVKRSKTSLFDDSAVRFADDLDVAPDGSIYLSDFSTRTNASDYMMELIEFRPNGRIVRVDPDGSADIVVNNQIFPNGVCTSFDGQSILIASTGLARVDRLWISGPKQGQLEPVIENMPGYPDNINRASDGNYWLSFVGMRTPMADLLTRYPSVRRRMTRELPPQDWVIPQMNVSCVVKFNEQGDILKCWWDGTLTQYPMVTSVNEVDGYLYLGGVHNNRVGRLKLDPEDLGAIDPRNIPGVKDQVRPFGGMTS